MIARTAYAWLLLFALAGATLGCRNAPAFRFHEEHHDHLRDHLVTQIDDPVTSEDVGARVAGFAEPLSIKNAGALEYRPMTLQETDLRTGVEQALSAFDAQFTSRLFFNRNERIFNNAFFGGGTNQFEQNTGEFRMEVAKRAATGSVFALRSVTNYDQNNSPANLFPGAWDQLIEAEVRHPLLQGSGLEFNRIAGPQNRPGLYNGVMIARVNTDIALADFELSVRNYVNDLERTYWGLYQAYRDLDAAIDQRDTSLAIWRRTRDKVEVGQSPPQEEPLAREQYLEAQVLVENALNGSPIQGATTQQYNPLTSLNQGVFGLERRLRFLMGMPVDEPKLIKPLDEPPLVNVVFDWEESLATALARRTELRRQRWAISRREMELTAAKNFLMGRLDFTGRLGQRGFGDRLFGGGEEPFPGAFQSLFEDGLNQWELGLSYETTIGNRLGFLAVRNAELTLMRERAIYHAQEEQVAHEVAGSMSEIERSYSVTRTAFNRRIAAAQRYEILNNRWMEFGEDTSRGGVPLEFLLEARRRSAQAEAQFYRALVDHVMAVSNTHLFRGTYLEYHNINLSEGPWSAAAHYSADRQMRRFVTRKHLKAYQVPPPASAGPTPQQGFLADPLLHPGPEELPTPPGTPPSQPLPVPGVVPGPGLDQTNPPGAPGGPRGDQGLPPVIDRRTSPFGDTTPVTAPLAPIVPPAAYAPPPGYAPLNGSVPPPNFSPAPILRPGDMTPLGPKPQSSFMEQPLRTSPAPILSPGQFGAPPVPFSGSPMPPSPYGLVTPAADRIGSSVEDPPLFQR